MKPATAPAITLAAFAYLDRPDAWHRAAARRRLAEGRTTTGAPDVDGPLGDALASLARAWDQAVLAEADATWSTLATPAERAGRGSAQAMVRRASSEQLAALCIGKARSVSSAYRDWFRRCGSVQGVGGRTWSGRHHS